MIGVLSLQGNFAEHRQVLRQLGVESKEVRTVADLQGVNRIILPGGESTVMSRLLTSTGLRDAIRPFPIFGTCAGAILLAKTILDGEGVDPLGLLDIAIQRNAYGRQLQSVRTTIEIQEHPVSVALIRAPKIVSVGAGVEVLATYQGDPVLVRQGNILAATFHAEVTGIVDVHRLWLL